MGHQGGEEERQKIQPVDGVEVWFCDARISNVVVVLRRGDIEAARIRKAER